MLLYRVWPVLERGVLVDHPQKGAAEAVSVLLEYLSGVIVGESQRPAGESQRPAGESQGYAEKREQHRE